MDQMQKMKTLLDQLAATVPLLPVERDYVLNQESFVSTVVGPNKRIFPLF